MNWRKRLVALCGGLLLLAAGSSVPRPAAVNAAPELPTVAPGAASPDFDGDGKADFAAAVYNGDVRSIVRVWYGSGTTSEILRPTAPLETGPGAPLLAADFNADGYTDLAYADADDTERAVVVQVFGSADGLDLDHRPAVTLPDQTAGIENAAYAWSFALISSPTPRLAVGARYPDLPQRVLIYDLNPAGLPTGPPLVLRPGSGKISSLTDASSGSFGDALASVGNRLFIGVPGAKVGGQSWAGAVVDVTMSASGVSSARIVTQSTKGVTGAAGKNDYFGRSLAAADGKLIVGTPYDDVESAKNTGSVQVFTVKSSGLTPVRRVSQYGSAVPGKAEASDAFGRSVALGRVCPNVTSMIVGGSGEEITHGGEGEGSVWLIPLGSAKSCPAQQLYQGHGLSGAPQSGVGLGGLVATLRDAGSSTDSFVLAGGGSFSEGPLGLITRWSKPGGQTMAVREIVDAVAGR